MSNTNAAKSQAAPHVYAAIAKITLELSKTGIAKDKKNSQQGYSFRGIDDVYAAVAKHLAENNLCILPKVIERNVVERQTKSGGALFYTTVTVDYHLVSAVDGSTHVATIYGEAMDSGDKATNKAMSAAHKYAMLMAFSIPTEGDNDADQAPAEVKKPTLTNNRFDNAVQKIIAKEYTVEQLRDTFALTAEQESALTQALANA